MLKYLIILLFLLTQVLHANSEELVIIHTVSSSSKTFVIFKGLQDGIQVGQESLFTAEKISLVATAIEVTRQFSLWSPSHPNVLVPFLKGETVALNSSIEKVWTRISQIEKEFDLLKRLRESEKIRPKNFFSGRFHLTDGLNQSITKTDADQDNDRAGAQYEITYHRSIWDFLELSLGVRYDYDSTTIKKPTLVIPTKRYIGLFDITFHFSKDFYKNSHLYASIATGYGRSETNVNEAVTVGNTLIFPSVRLGLMFPTSTGVSLLIELGAEGISTTEYFSDGVKQTSNITNAKLSLGLRF